MQRRHNTAYILHIILSGFISGRVVRIFTLLCGKIVHFKTGNELRYAFSSSVWWKMLHVSGGKFSQLSNSEKILKIFQQLLTTLQSAMHCLLFFDHPVYRPSSR